MLPKFRTTLLLMCLLPLAATAASRGDFAGKWVHIKSQGVRAEVSDNGGKFIVTTFVDQIVKKYSATYENGMLLIQAGARAAPVDVDRETGYLLLGGQQYRRLKPGEPFEYTRKAVPRF